MKLSCKCEDSLRRPGIRNCLKYFIRDDTDLRPASVQGLLPLGAARERLRCIHFFQEGVRYLPEHLDPLHQKYILSVSFFCFFPKLDQFSDP